MSPRELPFRLSRHPLCEGISPWGLNVGCNWKCPLGWWGSPSFCSHEAVLFIRWKFWFVGPFWHATEVRGGGGRKSNTSVENKLQKTTWVLNANDFLVLLQLMKEKNFEVIRLCSKCPSNHCWNLLICTLHVKIVLHDSGSFHFTWFTEALELCDWNAQSLCSSPCFSKDYISCFTWLWKIG